MSNKTGNSEHYSVDMVCLNCGNKERVQYPRGKEVPRKEICPNCGCTQMVAK